MKMHESHGHLVCYICYYKSKDEDVYKNHMQVHKKANEIPTIKKPLINIDSAEGMRTNLNGNLYSCSKCNQIFTNKRVLEVGAFPFDRNS